jgi:hypothetical protein
VLRACIPSRGPLPSNTRHTILPFDNYGLAFVGRPLWQEDGSVFCICCWPLPAQSFSGPSPLGLPTVFYCLRIETSLFVASYDSQGHGGGIRPRLHRDPRSLKTKSKSHCEWWSVSQSVSQSVSLGIDPHLGPMTRYLFLSHSYVLVSLGRSLWREDESVFCMCRLPLPAQSFSGPSHLGLATIFYCLRF